MIANCSTFDATDAINDINHNIIRSISIRFLKLLPPPIRNTMSTSNSRFNDTMPTISETNIVNTATINLESKQVTIQENIHPLVANPPKMNTNSQHSYLLMNPWELTPTLGRIEHNHHNFSAN